MSSNSGRDVIADLMADAGLEGDERLRASLEAVGTLAALPAPAPGPALAALMAGSSATPIDELQARRNLRESNRRRLIARRPVVVGASVLAAIGLGLSGVGAAAAGVLGTGPSEIVHEFIHDPAPSAKIASPSPTPAVPDMRTAAGTTPAPPLVAPRPAPPSELLPPTPPSTTPPVQAQPSDVKAADQGQDHTSSDTAPGQPSGQDDTKNNGKVDHQDPQSNQSQQVQGDQPTKSDNGKHLGWKKDGQPSGKLKSQNRG